MGPITYKQMLDHPGNTLSNPIFEVEWNFIQEEPTVKNYGDGTGYPGSDFQIEILSVKCLGCEADLSLATKEILKQFEDMAYEWMINNLD